LCLNLPELGRYPRCGHSVISGKVQYRWQDRQYALSWFGLQEKMRWQRIDDSSKTVSLRGDDRIWLAVV
jgi:hypothetical protein